MKLDYEFCFNKDEHIFHCRLLSYSAPICNSDYENLEWKFFKLWPIACRYSNLYNTTQNFAAVKIDFSLSTASLVFRVQWLSHSGLGTGGIPNSEVRINLMIRRKNPSRLERTYQQSDMQFLLSLSLSLSLSLKDVIWSINVWYMPPAFQRLRFSSSCYVTLCHCASSGRRFKGS
jgi:hypothetical protein